MSRILPMSDPLQIHIVKDLITRNYPKSIETESLQHTLECSMCRTFIAVHEGVIVATAGIRESRRVVWVATHPNFKRQGHAQALMETMQAIYSSLELWVKKDNAPAIHLYEKLGFIFDPTNDKEKSFHMIWRKS